MLRKAATGSAKNITPKREAARSKDAAGKAWSCASACSKLTLATPAVRSRARASSGAEMSTPRTRPAGPTAAASARVEPPAPQPTSSTASPGRAAQAASSRSVIACVPASSSASSSTQLGPAWSVQNAA